MSITKHTPGPWQADGTTVYAETRKDGLAVASTHSVADARLVATAPDLMDFVRRVVADAGASVCKGANGEPELCGGLDAAILLDEFYRHGRAAIARAEGAPK